MRDPIANADADIEQPMLDPAERYYSVCERCVTLVWIIFMITTILVLGVLCVAAFYRGCYWFAARPDMIVATRTDPFIATSWPESDVIGSMYMTFCCITAYFARIFARGLKDYAASVDL